MAVPKRRTSKSKRGMRRSHDRIRITRVLVSCEDCGQWKPRHTVCPECGTYKGKQVIATEED